MSLQPISPEILHKNCQEDVLLAEGLLFLPARLELHWVEELLSAIDVQARQCFESLYLKAAVAYFLRGTPFMIPCSEAGSISAFEVDLSDFYRLEQGYWILQKSVLPSSIIKLLIQGQETCLMSHQSPESVAEVARLLAAHPSQPLAPLNRYRVLNDTENYFFYRKAHEHVPGLMLIEVARQAMYHYFYQHSGFARGDVSISISALEVDFSNYVESAYELEVVVTQTQGLARKCPKQVDKTAVFYQNGRAVAQIRLRGGAIRMNIFKRMRCINFPETHWFSPSGRILSEALVTNGKGEVCRLKVDFISISSLQLQIIDTLPEHAASVSIWVSCDGFLTLPVDQYFRKTSERVVVLPLSKLSRDQAYRLREMIKCHCFFSHKTSETAKGRPLHTSVHSPSFAVHESMVSQI